MITGKSERGNHIRSSPRFKIKQPEKRVQNYKTKITLVYFVNLPKTPRAFFETPEEKTLHIPTQASAFQTRIELRPDNNNPQLLPVPEKLVITGEDPRCWTSEPVTS